MEIKENILSQKDYERLCKTPQEVCSMVSADLKVKGITRSQAASRLGVQAPVVTIQLSGKKYFGDKVANKYSSEFGYNPIFLKTGIGYLNSDPSKDSKLFVSKVTNARTKSIASSYIKYKALHEQLEEYRKNNESLAKERDRYQRLLETERQRNDKLNARIERLLDKLEAVPAL